MIIKNNECIHCKHRKRGCCVGTDYCECGHDEFMHSETAEDCPLFEHRAGKGMVKTGDRVKFTRCEYDNEYGLEGTVISANHEFDIFVHFDNGQRIMLSRSDITPIEAEVE